MDTHVNQEISQWCQELNSQKNGGNVNIIEYDDPENNKDRNIFWAEKLSIPKDMINLQKFSNILQYDFA